MLVTTGQCTVSGVTCLATFHSKCIFSPKIVYHWKRSFATCANIRPSAKVMVLLHSSSEFHHIEGFNPSEEVGISFEYSTQSRKFLKKIWISGVTKSETKLLSHTSFPSTLWIISSFYCVMHDPVLGLLNTSERHGKKEEYANNDEFKIIWNWEREKNPPKGRWFRLCHIIERNERSISTS